jgi:hypothetical protein
MAAFGPVDFFSEGPLEFLTFIGDSQEPQHIHRIDVKIDRSVKLDT